MSRPPAVAAAFILQAQAAVSAPAWFLPLVFTLIGLAGLAVQLVDIRHAQLAAAEIPPAAAAAAQEAP